MFTFTDYKKIEFIKLIELAQKNDYKALEEIIKREQDKVYMTFFYLCPDCDDLADLTQEALFKMCRGLKSLKNPKSFRGWLNKIISNIFYDKLRKKQNNPQCISTDETQQEGSLQVCQICDPCPCPDEKTLNKEVNQIIKDMIIKLPAHFRLVTVLREIGGLSYEEIAKVTGVELGTVKSRINRARHKLKECLEPYFTNN